MTDVARDRRLRQIQLGRDLRIRHALGDKSHAAIVARELGIPAVMSVPSITAIADGAWLEINGNTGTIHIR